MFVLVFKIILFLCFLVSMWSSIFKLYNEFSLTLVAWPGYFIYRLAGNRFSFLVEDGEIVPLLTVYGVIFFYGGLFILTFLIPWFLDIIKRK